MDSVPEFKVKYSPHPEKKGAFKKLARPCAAAHTRIAHIWEHPPWGPGYRRLCTSGQEPTWLHFLIKSSMLAFV